MAAMKFGLNIQKKSQPTASRSAPVRPKAAFVNDESDQEQDITNDNNGAEEISTFDLDGASKPSPVAAGKPSAKPADKKKLLISQYGDLSAMRTQRKHAEEATALDPLIYDYDAAYDALHANDAAKKAATKANGAERKPKYMNNLLAAAEVRKRDQLRAKDKQLQREREVEGDDFADKEKFVTGAYKAQQEEVRRVEEEEKRREEEEARKRRGLGMQGFYRSVLAMDEEKHQEAMEAAAKAAKSGPVAVEADAPKEKSELDVARELNAKGGNVIINDEGQVADKRQLLSAGLNIAPKPKPSASAAATASKTAGPQQAYQGRTSNQKAMRERQTRMLEEQLEQAAKRAADDEEEERRKMEHAAKSRKTEGDIKSAKERYLQRKREAAAATSKGSS